MKKRERLEVIRDILQVIRDNRNIKPTRILYSSNLSPQMFKEYMNELIHKKFIIAKEDSPGKKEFSLTKKGQEFLEKYKIIEEFVGGFGL